MDNLKDTVLQFSLTDDEMDNKPVSTISLDDLPYSP